MTPVRAQCGSVALAAEDTLIRGSMCHAHQTAMSQSPTLGWFLVLTRERTA